MDTDTSTQKGWFASLFEADYVSVLYAVGAILLYVLIVMLLGNGDTVFSVLITNAWEDLTGGATCTLTQKILAKVIDGNADHVMSDLAGAFITTLQLTLPIVVPFSVIDGSVTRYIKKKNKGTTIISFIAGYALQGIIALAWSEPISLDVVAQYSSTFYWVLIVVAFAFGGIEYSIRRSKGLDAGEAEYLERFDEKTRRFVSSGDPETVSSAVKKEQSIGTAVYYVFTVAVEWIKSYVSMMLFLLLAEMVIVLAMVVKIALLIRLLSVASPIIFLLFNRLIGPPMDYISSDLMTSISV